MTAYITRGWNSDPTQPLAHAHICDPDSTYTINGANYYGAMIPSVCRLTNGHYIALFENRTSLADEAVPALSIVKSLDGGNTWEVMKEVYRRTDFDSTHWVNGGSIGQNTTTGRIHVLFAKSVGTAGSEQKAIWTTYSDDLGSTWSTPTEITAANPGGSSYAWVIPGPQTLICMQYGAHAGAMVGTINTRNTIGTLSTPRVLYTLDDGANWLLGASFDRTDSSNDWAGESAIVEWGTSGAIYINSRFSTGNATRTLTRGHAICSDFTTGTITALATMKDTSNVTVPTLACTWSACFDDDGTLYCIGPAQSTQRAQVTVWYSLVGDRDGNGLPTFRRGTVLDYGYSGYSATLYDAARARFLSLVETTVSFSDETGSRQYVTPVRFNKERAKSTPATCNDTIILDFAEKSSGLTYNAGGMQGQDRGTHDVRWRGGAAVSYNARGLVFSGSGAGITLAQDQYNGSTTVAGAYSPWLDAYTWELAIRMPVGAAAAAQTLWFGGANRTFYFNAAHQIVAEMRDGTTTITATGSTALNDGADHWLLFALNRTDGKLRIYIDGVIDATSSTGVDPTKVVICTTKVMLGSTDSGTQPLPANFEVHQLQCTRGLAKTSDFLSGTPSKVTLAIRHGYTPRISPNDPSTISGLVLRLADPRMPGAMDRYSGTDLGRLPPVRGHGRGAFRNQVSGGFDGVAFTDGNSGSRGWTLDYDTTIGWHHRVSFGGTAASSGGIVMAHAEFGTNLDFIQNTALFSFLTLAKFITNPGSDQYLASIGGGGTPGFRFARQTADGKINLTIDTDTGGGGGGNRRMNAVVPTSSPALSLGNWYLILVTGHGPGVPLQYRVATFPGSLGAPTWSTAYVTSNVLKSDGTYNSTDPLSVFTNSNSNGADVRCGGVWIWNTAVDDAASLAKLAAFSVEQPRRVADGGVGITRRRRG